MYIFFASILFLLPESAAIPPNWLSLLLFFYFLFSYSYFFWSVASLLLRFAPLHPCIPLFIYPLYNLFLFILFYLLSSPLLLDYFFFNSFFFFLEPFLWLKVSKLKLFCCRNCALDASLHPCILHPPSFFIWYYHH